jgi:hypothetical protein
MSAMPERTLADTERLIADLQRQLDACRAELAARNSEYGERIEHQSATIDVPGVINSSPVRAGSRSRPPPRWGRAGVGVMPRTDPW